MTSQSKTMKEVVAELRRESVSALLEIYELDVAVGELTLTAHQLRAAVRELAEEAQELAKTPGLASPGKLEAFALYARGASITAESQALALAELKQGLAAWSISG